MIFQTVATKTPRTEPVARTAARRDPSAGPDAIVVSDLQKTYRSGFLKRRLRGVDGVSFSVPRGSVFALLGHNGAGKTTTINCILDLVRADGGEISIMGCDHRDCASRAAVGYLPERPYFFEHLSGRELLKFYAELLDLPRETIAARIDEVLAATGMTDHADRRLRKFSKGMLQRIGLAQTLLGDPEVLILDEPMSGLDPMGRREVRELLQDLKAAGKTIILSSHIVPDVELLADRVGILRDGRLIASHDLRDRDEGCSYAVQFSVCGARNDGAVLPDWAPVETPVGAPDRRVATAADAAQLREILAACHAADLPVHAVDTQRTGLEELFLAAHDHTEVDA